MSEWSKQSNIDSFVWYFGILFKHTVHKDFQIFASWNDSLLLLSFLDLLPVGIASVVKKQNDHS